MSHSPGHEPSTHVGADSGGSTDTSGSDSEAGGGALPAKVPASRGDEMRNGRRFVGSGGRGMNGSARAAANGGGSGLPTHSDDGGTGKQLVAGSGGSGSGGGGGGLMKDAWSIATLLLLYTLQGIPMGLASSIPLVLQQKSGVTMSQQALFSMVVWPYSLKLLWAPVVDWYHVPWLGRRKSWIIPVQLAVGGLMVLYSMLLPAMMEAQHPNVAALTAMFIVLYFLVATQDIAVDGWALTMLSRENVG